MSAYDTRERHQPAPVLHLEPGLPPTDPNWTRYESAGPRPSDRASAFDALLDRLADRVADAIIERLGGERGQHDEWLDSRQAAGYLGLHRDTLRRLAAARAIPAEQDGRGCRLFFRRAALDQWRRSGGRGQHLAAVSDAA